MSPLPALHHRFLLLLFALIAFSPSGHAFVDWTNLDYTDSGPQAFNEALASYQTDRPRMILLFIYSTNCSHCTVVGAAMNDEPAYTMVQEDFVIWRVEDPSGIRAWSRYLTDINPNTYPLIAVIDPRDDVALKASKASGFVGTSSEFKAYYETVRAVNPAQGVAASRDQNGILVTWETPYIRNGMSDNVAGYVIARYPGRPGTNSELSLQSRVNYQPGQTVNDWRILETGSEASFPPAARGGHSYRDTASLNPDIEYTYAVFAYTDPAPHGQVRRIHSPGAVTTADVLNVETDPVASGQVSAGNQGITIAWTPPGGNAVGVVLVRALTGENLPGGLIEGTTYAPGDAVGDAQVVYAGTGTQFVDSDGDYADGGAGPPLNNGTAYYYTLFAYSAERVYSTPFTPAGSPGTPNFLPFQPNLATVHDEFSCSADLSWRSPDVGNFAGIFILRNAGAPPPEDAAAARLLKQGARSRASDILGDFPAGVNGVAAGQITSITDTDLLNGLSYYYKIFAYDTDGTLSGGTVAGPAKPSFSYAALDPDSVALQWEYDEADGLTAIRLDWSYEDGQCIDGVLILHAVEQPVEQIPEDGTQYAGTFGPADVVLSGPGSESRAIRSFFAPDTNERPAGLIHHYMLFPMSAANEYGRGVAVSTDRDGDGLDDEWEKQYTYGVYDVRLPNRDADNDTLSNRYEFVHLTDPTNPADPNEIPDGLQLMREGWHNRPFPLNTNRTGNIGDHIDQFVGYDPVIWYWDTVGGGFRDGSADGIGSDRPYWLYLHSSVYMVVEDPPETPSTRAAVLDPVHLVNGWNNIVLPQWICDLIGPGKTYPTLGDFLEDELGQLEFWDAEAAVWLWIQDEGKYANGLPVASISPENTLWIWLTGSEGGVAIGRQP